MLHPAVLTFSLLLCENPVCLVEHSTSLSLSWRRPCTLGGDTPVWLHFPQLTHPSYSSPVASPQTYQHVPVSRTLPT